MGNYYYDALDSWSDPRSILPITPYEIWQYEKYGNFYKEKEHNLQTEVDQVPPLQITIYNNN
jgi:hypothetical protein